MYGIKVHVWHIVIAAKVLSYYRTCCHVSRHILGDGNLIPGTAMVIWNPALELLPSVTPCPPHHGFGFKFWFGFWFWLWFWFWFGF